MTKIQVPEPEYFISVAIGGTRFVIPQPTLEQVAAAKLQDLERSKG